MKETGKKSYRFRIAAIIFLLTVAALYFLIYIAPKFSDAFVETYTAELGTLDLDHEIDYVCVRNETVHTADSAGSITDRVKSGTLLRNNSRVLNIAGYEYRTRMRGIVSYYYDGLEKKLTPDKLDTMKISSLYPKEEKGKSSYQLKKCRAKSASEGDEVFKIVDNSKWYLVTWMEYEDASDIVQGRSVKVQLDDKDKTEIKFTVQYNGAEGVSKKKAKKNKKYKIILSCDRYYRYFGKLRYGSARVITSQKSGIILENDSITEVDGQQGVYVKNKYGDYIFTPISVIAVVGDKTVAESRTYYDSEKEQMVYTVKNYDSIKKGVDSGNVN